MPRKESVQQYRHRIKVTEHVFGSSTGSLCCEFGHGPYPGSIAVARAASCGGRSCNPSVVVTLRINFPFDVPYFTMGLTLK